MSVIRVQCETCNAVLRVRDEGFIGEVHACPRCGSMVLITRAADAGSGNQPPQPTEAPPTEEPSPTGPVMLGLAASLEATDEPPAPEPSPPPAAEVASPPAVEPEAVAPDATPALFSGAPLAITASALIAVGVIVAGWFVGAGGEAETPPTAVADNGSRADSVSPPAPVEEEPPAEAEPQADREPIDVSTKEAGSAVAEPAQPSLVVNAPADEVPSPASEPIAADQAPAVETQAALPPLPPADSFVAPTDEVAAEIDPLDFDPAEAELVLRRGPPSDGDSDRPLPVDAAPALPPETTEPREPTLDERLAAAGRDAGVVVELGPTDATTGPATRPAEAALSRVLPAIELRGAPLKEAIETIANLAGAPITIDPAALARAGVSASDPVDVVAEDATLAEVLAKALKGARLESQIDGPHVAVVRAGGEKPQTFEHRLDDLAPGDIEAFAESLRSLAPETNENEITETDTGFTLTAPRRVHLDLMILCERLRVARSLPTVTRYPADRLPTTPSLAGLGPVLERRTTFSFIEPTPLTDILAHWRRVTRLSILVDWRALAEIGLGERSRVECSVTNRPWGVALDGVLGPLGLGWAPVDDRTIRVSTLEAIAGEPTVELYPLSPREAEAVRGRLADERPAAVATYDRPSRLLMVRGTAATHRLVWSLLAPGAYAAGG